MRRLALALLLLPALLSPAAAKQPSLRPADLTAKAAVLLEDRTGRVLWAKNPHLALPPASTTKIMTVLVALEREPLTRVVTVSQHASTVGGSSIWLEAGERRTLQELIYGAMLSSGNDACVAIAENLADSEERYARWMTARARKLGARDTTFVNADGLPDPRHLASAWDLAKITREALGNPVFAEVVATKVKNIPWPSKEWDRRLVNHNKLLWRYQGADGVKTGYTIKSGRCFVASATRGGRRLIAVVLNSPRIYEEASALLDYGFMRLAHAGMEKILRAAGGTARVVVEPHRHTAVSTAMIATHSNERRGILWVLTVFLLRLFV